MQIQASIKRMYTELNSLHRIRKIYIRTRTHVYIYNLIRFVILLQYIETHLPSV